MKGIKVILILGLFSILTACAKPEAEYPVVVENIDGVKIVTNPDYQKDGVTVFSSEGIYLKQVLVKHRIYQLFEGKAFSLVRDEDDFVSAKRFLLVEKN